MVDRITSIKLACKIPQNLATRRVLMRSDFPYCCEIRTSVCRPRRYHDIGTCFHYWPFCEGNRPETGITQRIGVCCHRAMFILYIHVVSMFTRHFSTQCTQPVCVIKCEIIEIQSEAFRLNNINCFNPHIPERIQYHHHVVAFQMNMNK